MPSAITNREHSGAAARTTTSFRPDIQGLRMIAVIAVILDHLIGWPSGGFVGVDVFFVLSGFLITGLLLREFERTGTISFSGFYRRRVKRILPAAVLVLLVTVVASYFIFTATRFWAVVSDAVASLLFVANWRFAAVGADYFQADGPVSPLQHFWSLAVEEQFYLVWPWLMLLVIVALRRNSIATPLVVRWSVGLAMTLVVLVSFVWAMTESINNPNLAYFSTMSRAWELGIGALLAVASPLLLRIPSVLRPYLAWLGLAGIGLSFFVLSDASVFPAPTAAIPVIAAALVVAAGAGGTQRALWPITNPVARYLGDISYSLYLWHFPVIVFLPAFLTDSTSMSFYIWALLITLYLAIGSYHFVENPIRKSDWLEPEATRSLRTFGRTKPIALAVFTLVPALALLVGIAGGVADSRVDEIESLPSGMGSAVRDDPALPLANELTREIRSALVAESWPKDLFPTLAQGSYDWPGKEYGGCHRKDYSDPDSCAFGSTGADGLIAVLGDSLGPRLIASLREVFPNHRIVGFTRSGCVFLDIDVVASTIEEGDACAAHKREGINAVNALDADYVFVTNNAGGVRTLVSGAWGEAATQEWGAGLRKTIVSLDIDPSRVVVVASPPETTSIDKCATQIGGPSDCISEIQSVWRTAADGEREAAAVMKAVYIDTSGWYCSEEGLCPPFIGETLVKRDSIHPLLPFLQKIAPVLNEALLAQGIGRDSENEGASGVATAPR